MGWSRVFKLVLLPNTPPKTWCLKTAAIITKSYCWAQRTIFSPHDKPSWKRIPKSKEYIYSYRYITIYIYIYKKKYIYIWITLLCSRSSYLVNNCTSIKNQHPCITPTRVWVSHAVRGSEHTRVCRQLAGRPCSGWPTVASAEALLHGVFSPFTPLAWAHSLAGGKVRAGACKARGDWDWPKQATGQPRSPGQGNGPCLQTRRSSE